MDHRGEALLLVGRVDSVYATWGLTKDELPSPK
jgi:hypothetical protein